jgi:DNA (cytosine-5)-methyltransferase 1
MRALGCHIFAGGFSIGVEKHFELLAHFERGPLGVDSWRAYRPDVPVSINKTGTWPEAKSLSGKVDFVYANPPCSPWSVLVTNKDRRWLDHPHLSWTRDALVVAQDTEARVLALESVRGAYRKGREHYRKLRDEFGWKSLSWIFVNAADHGLAQRRLRLFIVFARDDVFAPEWSPRPLVSVTDAIAGAPADEPISPKSIYNPGRGVKPQDLLDCIPAVVQGSRITRTDPAVLETYNAAVAEYVRNRQTFDGHTLRRLTPDGQADVVLGLPRHIHPVEDRVLTVRELCRLMGYPDDFQFLDKHQANRCRTMGKSVCPPVGEWLAGEVAAHLRGERDVSYVDERVFWCASDPMKLPPEPRGAVVLMDNGGSMLTDPLSGVASGDPLAGSSDEEDAFLVNLTAKPEPTGTLAVKVARRAPGTRPSSAVRTLPADEVQAAWLSLPGPTALARILIAEGRGDEEVLSATKTCFGGRTDGTPHLFTRADLVKLRERIAKKEAQA